MAPKLFLHAHGLCLEETEWENCLEMEMVTVPHWGMGATGEHDSPMLLLWLLTGLVIQAVLAHAPQETGTTNHLKKILTWFRGQTGEWLKGC